MTSTERTSVPGHAIGGLALLLAAALLLGCGGEQEPAAAVPEAEPMAVAPGQMRQMLEGLKSPNARTQYGALMRLSEYPTVLATYRDEIERVATSGADNRVRQKAAEVLASLPEPEEE